MDIFLVTGEMGFVGKHPGAYIAGGYGGGGYIAGRDSLIHLTGDVQRVMPKWQW